MNDDRRWSKGGRAQGGRAQSAPGPVTEQTGAGEQTGGRQAEGRGSRADRAAARSAGRAADRAAGRAADPVGTAREIVLQQLTAGARSRAQLRQVLLRKQIPEDVATAVLDRFEEVELVDDEEFARQWVQSRHLGRGLARRALAYELRQRGVAEETLKNAVDELTSDDELSAARELVRRKATTMRNDDPQRRVRRLAGMLARKGYGGAVAMQAIREELAEFDLPDLDDDGG